jgi:hypothetical protein
MTTTLPVPAPFGLIPPLPAPSGVVPPGPLIKANDTAKIAAGKILAFSALIIAITSSFPYYLNLIRENLNILDKALEALDKLIAQIDQLIQLLEQLYLQLLKNMQLTNPSDSGINPLDSASTPEDLYAQLPNLEGLGDLPHQPNYALKREIKELKESIQSSSVIEAGTKPKRKKMSSLKPGAKRKKPIIHEYAKNPALNDLLNETAGAASEWANELGGGGSVANLSQPFMTGDPLPTEGLPESIEGALTRDYSGLMEAMDKK